MGTQTPWGKADSSEKIACGIVSYSTPSHGGIHVTQRILEMMPEELWIESGWYEEDCDWCLVAVAFPLLFKDSYKQALESMRNWHPDRYEKYFGVELKPEESLVKRQQLFDALNVNNFVVTTAWGDWHEKVPAGMVGVLARRKSDGKERYWLIPKSEYITPCVVNIERHVEWEGTE